MNKLNVLNNLLASYITKIKLLIHIKKKYYMYNEHSNVYFHELYFTSSNSVTKLKSSFFPD